MKKKVSVKTYKRKTKSGKIITVKQHTTNREGGKDVKGISGRGKYPITMNQYKEWWEGAEPGDATDKAIEKSLGEEGFKALCDAFDSGASKSQCYKIAISKMKSGGESEGKHLPKPKAEPKVKKDKGLYGSKYYDKGSGEGEHPKEEQLQRDSYKVLKQNEKLEHSSYSSDYDYTRHLNDIQHTLAPSPRKPKSLKDMSKKELEEAWAKAERTTYKGSPKMRSASYKRQREIDKILDSRDSSKPLAGKSMKAQFDFTVQELKKANIPADITNSKNEVTVELGFNYPDKLADKVFDLCEKKGVNVSICARSSGGRSDRSTDTTRTGGGPRNDWY